MKKGKGMQYNIAFLVDSIPFTREDAVLQSPKGLGGSESALLMTAYALSRRGHNVHMFSTQLDDSFKNGGMANGVFWADAQRLGYDFSVVDWDIFISQRQMHPFIHNSKCPAVGRVSRFSVIWHEDFILNSMLVDHALSQVDANFFVSEWQRDNFADEIPYIRKNSLVTRNAVELDWINKYQGKVEKDPNKLIVVSRPERSIENLIPIFIKMKQIKPELELNVCRYYSMYEPNPDMRGVLDYHDRLLKGIPGIKYLGNLSKDELYEEMASSKLVVYPTNFDETSCIAAIEAQAIGTPMVTTNRGALQETLHDNAGIKIDGDARSEEYRTKFVDSVFGLLYDDDAYAACVEAGLEHAKQYDADIIAKEWEKYFDVRFERRFNAAKQKIYDNLIWYDDVVAAEYLAEKYPREVTPIPKRDLINIEDFGKFIGHKGKIEVGTMFQDVRFRYAQDIVTSKVKKDSGRVLDFACGNGTFVQHLIKTVPDYEIVGIDKCEEFYKTLSKFFKDLDNVTIKNGSIELIDGKYDLIFCGEFIEHARNYMEVLETFEDHLSDYGTVIVTVPTGPISRIANPDPLKSEENHVIHWTLDDIKHVFGEKTGFDVSAYHCDFSVKGELNGHFVIVYHKGGEFKPLNFEKKIRTFRPRQTLSVGIACKDSQRGIRNALESIKDIADEIVVCDSGSSDNTIAIAKEYTDKVFEIGTCPYVPEDTPAPGAFDWLNNEVLMRCTGDWFMKLDSDEELVDAENLRKYLRFDSYHDGFNLKQVHLQQDKGIEFDVPVRVFRNNDKYIYYGVLHEQPQKTVNINRSIYPQLILEDTNIAHYGYLTEKHREGRAINRNIKLMELDRKINPNRELGHLLWIRESINRARVLAYNNDSHAGVKVLKDALEEWRKYFSDPMHRLYKVGIDEVYMKILNALDMGIKARIRVKDSEMEFRFDKKEYFEQYVKAMMGGFRTYIWDEYHEEYLKIQDETSVDVSQE